MSEPLEIQFAPLSAAPAGTLVLLAGQELALAPTARGLDERMKGALSKAARAADFTGKAKTRHRDPGARRASTPSGCCWSARGGPPRSWTGCCSAAMRLAQISARKGDSASLVAEPADPGEASAEVFAADLALGALLRSYTFKKYRTTPQVRGRRRGRAARRPAPARRSNAPSPTPPPRLFAARKALAEGVFLARDLVNEPANVLGPVEFAERMRDLSRAGLEVEVLDEDQLAALEDGRAAGGGAGQRAALARGRACSGTAPSPSAPRRCASSARACASIPAASP